VRRGTLPAFSALILLAGACVDPWPLGSPAPIPLPTDDDDARDDETMDDDDVGPTDGDGDGVDSDEDCDDEDETIFPGAHDVLCDDIDQDCSGTDRCRPELCDLESTPLGLVEPEEDRDWAVTLPSSARVHGGEDCFAVADRFGVEGSHRFTLLRVFTTVGGRYRLDADSADFDPWLAVLNATCECVAFGDGGPGEAVSSVEFDATHAANYLLVTSLSDESGTFVVTSSAP